MSSFGSFAGALGQSLGENALALQKEQRAREDEKQKQRIDFHTQALKDPAIANDPQQAHDHFEGLVNALYPNDKKARELILQHAGSTPAAWKAIQDHIASGETPSTTPGQPSTQPLTPGTPGTTPQFPPATPTTNTSAIDRPELAPPMPERPAYLGNPQAAADFQYSNVNRAAEAAAGRTREEKAYEEKLAEQRKQAELKSAFEQKQKTFQTIVDEAEKAGHPLSDRQQTILHEQIHGVKLSAPKPIPGSASTGQQVLAAGQYTHDLSGAPIDPGGNYTNIMDPFTQDIVGVVPKANPVRTDTVWKKDEAGRFYKNQFHPQTGALVGRTYGEPGQNFTGSETTTANTRETPQVLNGKLVMVPAQSSTTVQRRPIGAGPTPTTPMPQAPGQSATPSVPSPIPPKPANPKTGVVQGQAGGYRVIGDKGLTPEQQLTNERSNAMIEKSAIPTFTDLYNNSHVLDSIISAGKIQFALDQDGKLKAVLGRGLSPEETQYARKAIRAIESVNLERQAFQAAGFRGHEGWQGLQGLKGQVLSNPALTRGILSDTVRDFLALRAVNSKGSGKPLSLNSSNPVDLKIMEAYKIAADGDDARAYQLATEDGYTVR